MQENHTVQRLKRPFVSTWIALAKKHGDNRSQGQNHSPETPPRKKSTGALLMTKAKKPPPSKAETTTTKPYFTPRLALSVR